MFYNVEITFWWDYDDQNHYTKYVVYAESYAEAINKIEKRYKYSSFIVFSLCAEAIEDTEDGIWEIDGDDDTMEDNRC